MTEETATENVQAPWPEYQSHKRVRALKLDSVGPDTAEGFTRFICEDKTRDPLVYDNRSEVVKRCQAVRMGDPGYLVLYEDGFTSWSPSKAFEGGYTLLETGS